MALTAKKRAFGDASFAGKANKDAAIAAGYSAKTASQAGSRLVKDEDVVLYITALRARAAKAAVGDPSEADPDAIEIATHTDPMLFLKDVMNLNCIELRIRVDSAKALLPFMHTKKGEGGKADAKEAAAKAAGQGKFGATRPPLSVVKKAG